MGKVGRDDRDPPAALYEDFSGSDRDVFPWYFPGNTAEMLNYMGTVSGRTEDKIAKSGLTESLVMVRLFLKKAG